MTSASAHKPIDPSALTDARDDEVLPARAVRAPREAPAADRADRELSVPEKLAAEAPAWSPGLSKLAAGLGIFFGLTGLLQWTVFPSLLVDRSSVWPVLKPNVSASVLLSGIAVMLLNRQP